MRKLTIYAGLTIAAVPAAAHAEPIPISFASAPDDRMAIEALLGTYTQAVLTTNQALFEMLLLGKDIPFSDVGTATRGSGGAAAPRNYEGFRAGVVEGPPFAQSFRDVHIEQDGALAHISLVFVNKAADGTSWGWKTLQLPKVAGKWKIASEFFTGHPSRAARSRIRKSWHDPAY